MSELEPAEQRALALQVVERLRSQGHQAYWAGGCVRDQLLGRMPKDYDVATDATPEAIRTAFGRRRTLAIGVQFGVISVLGRHRGEGQVEVATFRRDATYSDGRHPDAVTFSTPEEDAQRRDFTINGLFYDPFSETVIDYVGGQADLQAGVVRAIGDPFQRFAEDKLRMLRAVRFAATFEFQLDPPTAAAISGMAPEVAVVSAERIAQEMRQLLVLPGRVRALQLLREVGLLGALLPECVPMQGLPQHKRLQPGGDLWDHTLAVVEALRHPTFPLALAALLHDVGKVKTMTFEKGRLGFYDHELVGAGIAGDICRRWRLSRREEGRICWLVKHHMYLAAAKQMRWAKLQRMLTQTGIEELLALHEADALASHGDLSQVDYCRECLRRPPEELAPQALLSGHDLIRQGIEPGPRFQELLEAAYDAQLEKRVRNKREALALVEQLWSQRGAAPIEPRDESPGLPEDGPPGGPPATR